MQGCQRDVTMQVLEKLEKPVTEIQASRNQQYQNFIQRFCYLRVRIQTLAYTKKENSLALMGDDCLQAVCTRARGTVISETAYKFHKGRAKAKFRGKYEQGRSHPRKMHTGISFRNTSMSYCNKTG